mgnify:CR=1 FL=1
MVHYIFICFGELKNTARKLDYYMENCLYFVNWKSKFIYCVFGLYRVWYFFNIIIFLSMLINVCLVLMFFTVFGKIRYVDYNIYEFLFF